jgi:hypothetical protein
VQYEYILAGAIPIALIAILIDIGLRLLEKKLDPTHRSSKQVPRIKTVPSVELVPRIIMSPNVGAPINEPIATIPIATTSAIRIPPMITDNDKKHLHRYDRG